MVGKGNGGEGTMRGKVVDEGGTTLEPCIGHVRSHTCHAQHENVKKTPQKLPHDSCSINSYNNFAVQLKIRYITDRKHHLVPSAQVQIEIRLYGDGDGDGGGEQGLRKGPRFGCSYGGMLDQFNLGMSPVHSVRVTGVTH